MFNPKDFLPNPPWDGPPIPRGLAKPQTYDVSTELNNLTENKRREWLIKYPDKPGLVEKALNWAREWTSGLLESELYSSLSQVTKAEISVNLYKSALVKAENWMKPFL